jgi:hypothetical protein
MSEQTLTLLQQFRAGLYHSFRQRADAVFELIDALASDTQARSPVELSLSPAFRRQYASVYDGLDGWQDDKTGLKALLLGMASAPPPDGFRLIGLDHTPKPRPYAETVSDRSFVYQPTPIAGNKPVTIGHTYSVIGQIDLTSQDTWLAVLDVERISTDWIPLEVGLSQVIDLARRCDDWLVIAGDSEYSQPLTVACLNQCEHVSGVFRLRSNRKLYRRPGPYSGKGHPRWHGPVFRLNDPATWSDPDESQQWTETDERGRLWIIHLRRWCHLHFREARHHEFDVVQIQVTNRHGQPRFRRPCWLLLCGQRPLSLTTGPAVYQRRPVMEHYFRFIKQRLLFTAAQLGTTEHEEKFVQVIVLAYEQLYLARFDVEPTIQPWERSKPAPPVEQAATPAQTRRGFARLLARIGTPAQPPKPRGKSPGRPKGTRPPPRPRYLVVKKGQMVASVTT